MTIKKTLVAGFVGTRPAVIYAALVPLLDEITSDGNIDLLFAATEGIKGTEHYHSRLRTLPPLSKHNWLKMSFPQKESETAIDKMVEIISEYDRVYIFLKGGMGIWMEQLVFAVTSGNVHQKLFFITSDGRETILTDAVFSPIMQKPLASLGLTSYLTLHNLEADCEPNEGIKYSGHLKRATTDDKGLPFWALLEEKGFLYTLFWVNEWLPQDKGKQSENEAKSPYQKFFREHLEQCRELGLELGRIMLVAKEGTSKADVLKKRAEQESIHFQAATYSNKQEQRQAAKLLIKELKGMADKANPRNFLKVKEITPPKRQARGMPEQKFLCETLVMATSATDSFVNLLAIATHKPRRVILFYDDSNTDTLVAASRLSKLLMQDNTMGCEQFIPINTDRMGASINSSFAEHKMQFDGEWDINLTPGTKEQSLALLLAAGSSDRLWISDARKREMCKLDTRENCIGWQFPKLCHIASHLGGPLRENGLVIKKSFITEANQQAVMGVFTYLTKKKNKAPLSDYMNGAVVDDGGILQITQKNRKYNMKELFPWFIFHGSDGQYDSNLWFEVFTACALFLAGADEVVCGIKWKWDDRQNSNSFKDELDVVARFGSDIAVVSCKTNKGKEDKLRKNLREVEYIARHCFGSFAKPFLAAPVFVQPGSECILGTGGMKKAKTGCKTYLLGINQMSSPKTLGEFIHKTKL
jgi:hypothetical protein